MNGLTPNLRRGGREDAADIARIHRAARAKEMPWLPELHTPEEDLAFLRDSVLVETEVWIAEFAARPAGFIALRPGWIDHLYVDPDFQGNGAGRHLMWNRRPVRGCVHLWTFERNLRARRFYEYLGYEMVERTNGRRNEEKEPDMLYRWGTPE